jgi:hypothetical protein
MSIANVRDDRCLSYPGGSCLWEPLAGSELESWNSMQRRTGIIIVPPALKLNFISSQERNLS